MAAHSPEKQNLFELDLAGMKAFFASLGEKPYRAGQLMNRIYKKEARDFDCMTEFGAPLRQKLTETATLALPRLFRCLTPVPGTLIPRIRPQSGILGGIVVCIDGRELGTN